MEEISEISKNSLKLSTFLHPTLQILRTVSGFWLDPTLHLLLLLSLQVVMFNSFAEIFQNISLNLLTEEKTINTCS
jgi:hypothetical protein